MSSEVLKNGPYGPDSILKAHGGRRADNRFGGPSGPNAVEESVQKVQGQERLDRQEVAFRE